jgi:uridine phosphorylase
LQDAHEVAFNREYRTFTGTLSGVKVSTVSSGIGGPSLAIAIEELSALGVHTFLRIGTCGAAQPQVKLGDLLLATGCVRSESTPSAYVPLEYPALASLDVVNALVASAQSSHAPFHLGILRSVDALYADLAPDSMPRAVALKADLAMWARAGILGNDMETSTLLVVAALRHLRAGTINLCVNELGALNIPPLNASYVDRMLQVAIGAVQRLIESDRAAKQ